MQQWLTEIGTLIIAIFMSLGNGIASIGDYLPDPPTVSESNREFPRLASLAASAENIPNILIENSVYQAASVAGSQPLTLPAADPAEALVNIYCTYQTDTSIRHTTGTGFFVAPTGVILTNAHVAQFLLLEAVAEESAATNCIIRSGSPAVATYEAELLYISPMWVRNHADMIASADPKGTGERDYALLYLTKGIDNSPLPAAVPYINVDTNLVDLDTVGNTATIGGYPAANRAINEPGTLLRQTDEIILEQLFTFDTTFGDIYLLGESPIGQAGISGGPVINAAGDAVGLIVTQGNEAIYGPGSLNAITLSYIARTIEEETTLSFARSIGGNLSYRAHIFKQTLVPFLAGLLEAEL